jgi:hypothetical protein
VFFRDVHGKTVRRDLLAAESAQRLARRNMNALHSPTRIVWLRLRVKAFLASASSKP